MIDVIILENPTLPQLFDRAISSIVSQDDAPHYCIHVVPYSRNTKLMQTPGSIYNAILAECNNPLFTILSLTDFYTIDAFNSIAGFVKYKQFGLIYASSLNQNNNKVNPIHDLPLLPEIVYRTNPMKAPVFYNRKVFDYLCGFDFNTGFPEYDMCLKIWEKFPVCYLKKPILYTKTVTPSIMQQYDLDRIIHDSKIRNSKYYMNAGPNQYPQEILNLIC